MPLDFDINAVLQVQLGDVSRVTNQLQRQIAGVNTSVNVNTSGAVSGVRQLTGGLSAAESTMRALQERAAVTNGTLAGSVRVTADLGGQLGNLAAQAGLAARRFIAFSLAAGALLTVVNGFKQGVKAAIDFDLSMNKVAQVSNEAGANIGRVRQTISELATTMGVSSASLAEAAVTIKQAGLSAEETNAALKALALTDLAPTFDGMKQSAEGLIASLRQFNLSARDYETVLGSMNAVSAEFAVESADLITAVQKAGGAFKQTGGDLNEFLGLFTSVRATTREGADTIATGLRTIFTRLQRNDTVSALRDLGINLRYTSDEAAKLGKADLTNQFVGAYEAVRRLSEGLEGLRTTDPRYSAVVEQLGGYRQISRVIPLLKQFEDAERAKNVAIAGGISLQATAEKRQETLANKIDKLKETYLELFRKLVDSNGFRSLANTAILFADSLAKVLDYVRPLVPLLTTLAGIKLAANLGTVTGNLLGSFSATVGSSTLQPRKKFASGGPVMVPGSGNTDSVPADLPVGSFVLRKSAVKSMRRGVGLGVAVGSLLAGGNDAKTFAEYDLRSRADRSRKHAVSALLMPGELVFGPEDVKKYGKENLERMNRRGYAAGGLVRLEEGGDPAEKRRKLFEKMKQSQAAKQAQAARRPAGTPAITPEELAGVKVGIDGNIIPPIPLPGPSEAELERKAREASASKFSPAPPPQTSPFVHPDESGANVEKAQRDAIDRAVASGSGQQLRSKAPLTEQQTELLFRYLETAQKAGRSAARRFGADAAELGDADADAASLAAAEHVARTVDFEKLAREKPEFDPNSKQFDKQAVAKTFRVAAARKVRDEFAKRFGRKEQTIGGLGTSIDGETTFDLPGNELDPADFAAKRDLSAQQAAEEAAARLLIEKVKPTGADIVKNGPNRGELSQKVLQRTAKLLGVKGGGSNEEILKRIQEGFADSAPVLPRQGGGSPPPKLPPTASGEQPEGPDAPKTPDRKRVQWVADGTRAIDLKDLPRLARAMGLSTNEFSGLVNEIRQVAAQANKLGAVMGGFTQVVLQTRGSLAKVVGLREVSRSPAEQRLDQTNALIDAKQKAVDALPPLPALAPPGKRTRLDEEAERFQQTQLALAAEKQGADFGVPGDELARRRAAQEKAARVAGSQDLADQARQAAEQQRRNESRTFVDPLVAARDTRASRAQDLRQQRQSEEAANQLAQEQALALKTRGRIENAASGVGGVTDPLAIKQAALAAINDKDQIAAFQKNPQLAKDFLAETRKHLSPAQQKQIERQLTSKVDVVSSSVAGGDKVLEAHQAIDQARSSPGGDTKSARAYFNKVFYEQYGRAAGTADLEQLSQGRLPTLAQGTGQSQFVNKLVSNEATKNADAQIAARGGAELLSQETQDNIRSKAVIDAEHKARRELTSAQERLVAALYPEMQAHERAKIVASQVNDAMAGLVPVVRATNGKLLGLQSTVDKATANGISASGAGGVGFRLGQFGDKIRGRLSGVSDALFTQNRFSSGADAFASKFSGFGTVAAIGGGFLASQLDPSQESKERAVAAGNTSGVQTRQGAAGGLQGAVVGASIGAALGSVIPGIGTAIGGAVGAVSGGLYGLVDSLKQAENDIKTVQIGNSLKNFGERLNDANSLLNQGKSVGADTSRAIADEIKSVRDRQQRLDFDASNHTFSGFNADEFTNLRKRSDQQQFSGSIPSLLNLLNKQAEQEGRAGVGKNADTLVSSLLERNGGANRTILNTLASTRGISAEQQQDELVKTVRKGQLAAANEAQNKNTIAAETRTINTFGRLVASVQAAADSMDRLHRQGDVLNNTIEGVAGTYHVSAGTNKLDQLGRPDQGALEPLRLIAAVGGEQGQKLLNAGSVADAVRGALPSVLAGAVAAGPNADQDISTTVRQGLTSRLGKGADVADAINSVVRQFGELTNGGDVSKVLDEVHADTSKFSDKLASVLTDPIKDAGTKFAGQIEAQANKYVTELNKLTRHTQLINQNFDAIDQLQVQKTRVQAQFEGQDTGRANQLLDKIPLAVLNAPFQARQERLTGLRGDAATSPTALGANLRDTNRQLEEAVQKQQESFQKPNSDAFKSAAENVRRLSERSANLTQALKNLTDVSGRAAAAQEKLTRFQQERDSRLSLAEKYATGTPEELGRLNRGFAIAKTAAEGRGNLDGLTQEDRRNAIESLRAAGTATLTGIEGAPRADDLLRKLLENSFGGQFKLTAEQQKDEAAARADVIKAITDAQAAYAELAKSQKEDSQRFFQNLTTQHGQFYARLSTLFAQDRLTDKQNALGTASSEVGRLTGLQADQQRLAAAGVTTTFQVSGLKDKRSDVEALGKQLLTNAKDRELFDKAIANSGVAHGFGNGTNIFGRNTGNATALDFNKLLESSGLSEKDTSAVSARAAYLAETRVGSGRGLFESKDDYAQRVAKINQDALVRALTEQKANSVKAGDAEVLKRREAIAKVAPGINQQALENTLTAKDGPAKFFEALDKFGADNPLETLGKRVGDAAAQIALLQQQVKQLNDAIAVSRGEEQKFAAATPAVGKAFGGAIFSPKGTDTVPAMLTPKEFVVNAKSAQANLSLLKQINAANGPVYRADGGVVDPRTKALNDAYEQKEAARREAQRQSAVDANLAGDRKTQADATSAQAANQAYFVKEQQRKAAEAEAVQRANEQYEAKARRGEVAPTGLYGTNGLTSRRAKAGDAAEQGKGLTLDDELTFLAKSNRFGASALYKAKARANQQYTQRLQRAEARGITLKQSREDFVGTAAARFNFRANRALAQRQAVFNAGTQRVGDEGFRTIANAQFQRRAGETNNVFRQDPESRAFLNRRAALGVVPGTGNTDSVNALLTPGEGVLNKAAMRRLGAKNVEKFNKGGVVGGVNYLASGGSVQAASSSGGTLNLSSEGVQAMNSLSRTINQFVQAAGGLGETAKSMTQAFGVFNGSAKALTDALNAMPKQLTITGQHQVNVVINGAEAFSKMQGEFKEFVTTEIKNKFAAVFKDHMPEAGVQVG